MPDHIFTKNDLENILNQAVGKTLKEVDKNNVFDRTKAKPKITGIAGDVIEQSVLGYAPDTKQSADLLVDNVPVELKTTGIRYSKKDKKSIEAKEPMSITAVSPKNIIHENFDTSKFWNKIAHTLFVYYFYDSESTVKAAEYANFRIQGYQFHQFNEHDVEILKNDWSIVRNFIRNVDEENIDTEYPKISKLRNQMMYLDTAPKWPHSPRFRLKKAVVTNIVQQYLGKHFETLTSENSFNNYSELDKKLHEFTNKYKGKTLRELAFKFDIPDTSKNIAEKVMVKMFGSNTSKLRDIDNFNKLGIIPKTIKLNCKGKNTEDMKFEVIDFSEWTNKRLDFNDSRVYNFFLNPILLIIFQETKSKGSLLNATFEGFKRFTLDKDLPQSELKSTWNEVRRLIWNKDVRMDIMYKKDGQPMMTPKTKIPKKQNNLPKSSQYIFFLRGSGGDANGKTLVLNGINMYPQYVWIRGTFIANLLSKMQYI